MKIRRMQLVIPPRMKGHVLHDARVLAKAAAQALEQGQISGNRFEIQGLGRPATLIAKDIGRKNTTTSKALDRRN